MNRRIAILAAIAAAGVAALAAVAVIVAGGDGGGDAAPPLRASPLPEPIPAPLTVGLDSTGREVRVPAESRPAVVTFLFANCPTVCPLVGAQVSRALDRVSPGERSGLDVVAVSVDPEGDTREAVTAFLARYGLTGRMQYLVGPRRQLAPLWASWGVMAQPGGDVTASVHTARVVLVDRRGRQVGSYPGGIPIPPDDLAADIRTLVASR